MPALTPRPPHSEIVPEATSLLTAHLGVNTVVYFILMPARTWRYIRLRLPRRLDLRRLLEIRFFVLASVWHLINYKTQNP